MTLEATHFKLRPWPSRLAVGAASALLSACGGGGDSTASGGTAGTPLPPFTETIGTVYPAGTRTDVSALNLFPFSSGDRITYARTSPGKVNGVVTRVNTQTTTQGIVSNNIVESDSSGGSTTTAYRVFVQGGEVFYFVNVPWDTSGKPWLSRLGPEIAEYLIPLMPTGGARLFASQGDTGADLDGDGKTDTYRLQWSQIYVGMEPIAALGATREAAHFTSAWSYTTRYTTGRPDVVVASAEDTYYASGIGLIRRDRTALTTAGRVDRPASNIVAQSASVGGVTYP